MSRHGQIIAVYLQLQRTAASIIGQNLPVNKDLQLNTASCAKPGTDSRNLAEKQTIGDCEPPMGGLLCPSIVSQIF